MNPKVRPLAKSDIPDILEISRTTWGGHDHLPTIIDSWLANQECHPFVLDDDGTVLGVANIRIIDQGKTG